MASLWRNCVETKFHDNPHSRSERGSQDKTPVPAGNRIPSTLNEISCLRETGYLWLT
jgi:hypothetical protein